MGIHVSIPLALAAVATLGYMVGRWGRAQTEERRSRSRVPPCRIPSVAEQLEEIVGEVRESLSEQRAGLSRFKQRVAQLSGQQGEPAWHELCREAEEMFSSSLRLAAQVASAYSLIREHSSHAVVWADVPTDSLTGLCSPRGLYDVVGSQLALLDRYGLGFSIAMFDVDHSEATGRPQGHCPGDDVLKRLARLLKESARETDVLARCGIGEFAAVMPQTDLEGASAFAEHFRKAVEQQLPCTVSGGVTTALDGDSGDSVLARASAALDHARADGRNRVFRHDGREIESVLETCPAGGAQQ